MKMFKKEKPQQEPEDFAGLQIYPDKDRITETLGFDQSKCVELEALFMKKFILDDAGKFTDVLKDILKSGRLEKIGFNMESANDYFMVGYIFAQSRANYGQLERRIMGDDEEDEGLSRLEEVLRTLKDLHHRISR